MLKRNLLSASKSLQLGLRPASFVKASTSLQVKPYISTCFPIARFHSSNTNNLIEDNKTASLKTDAPQLMIAFTCKKCDTRSSHTFSKQSYVKGSVLIQCPGCKNRHLIADNLKIFGDGKVNLEDILKAKGESVSTTTDDLAFEDIPESLKKVIGHHAKDVPEDLKTTEATDFQGLPNPDKQSNN